MKNTCKTCNMDISFIKIFCSHECYYKSLVGKIGYWRNKKRPELKKTGSSKTMFKKNQIPWNKNKRVCLNTGKTHFQKGCVSWMKGKSNPYKGERHWNWKGGIARKRTNPDKLQRVMFRKEIQKLVLKRDDFTCQICGIKGVDLQVDHIQSWAKFKELRFDLNNCRTLCIKCHYKITFGKEMPENIKGWGHHLIKGGY